MPKIINFPLYYTSDTFSNVTNSGIVNVYGSILHKSPTDFIEAPEKNVLSYIWPDIASVTNAGTMLPVTEERNYTTYPLGLFYATEVILGIKKGTYDLLGDLNVISVEDIIGYIVPTQQLSTDIISFVRPTTPLQHSLEAIVDVTVLTQIYQIFSKGDFVYAAIGTGLAIFDAASGEEIYVKKIPNKISKTLWGTNTTLYIGSLQGLSQISYETLHGNYEDSIIEDSFSLDSPTVLHIHGYENKLLICTTSGVEYFALGINPEIHSKITLANVSKCFMTNTGAYYIEHTTTSGVLMSAIHRKDNLLTDWSEASYSYKAGEGILPTGIYLTDIFITTATTYLGNNTIFCTTTSGIYAIDEDTLEFATYYTR